MFGSQQAYDIMRNIHIQATGEYWKTDFKKNRGNFEFIVASVEVRVSGDIGGCIVTPRRRMPWRNWSRDIDSHPHTYIVV